MHQRLEAKRLRAEKTSTSSKVTEQDAKKKKDNLSTEVKYLVLGGTTLSATKTKRRDYDLRKAVMNELRKMQQNLISRVSFTYPLKIKAVPSQDQELDSFPGTKLVSDPFTKMSFFTDKNEVQMPATALGYVAHAVTLIASYLTVPFRYPLRFVVPQRIFETAHHTLSLHHQTCSLCFLFFWMVKTQPELPTLSSY